MAKRPKRPSDPNQLAKLIVDMATGEKANDSRPLKKKAGKKRRSKNEPTVAD